MIRFAILLTLAACGTHQTTPPDATQTPLPSGSRTPAPDAQVLPMAPPGTDAIMGLLRAHETENLPERSTVDAHDDAVGSLVWIASHGDPLAVRGRALRLLGQYSDDRAVQAQREAVADLDAHPILVAAAIRGLTDRGLTEDSESYELILKREAETDARIVAAVVLAKDSVNAE